MNILDSYKKNNWKTKGVMFSDKNIIMNSKSKLSSELSNFNSVSIKIIGKKISGNGHLILSIKNKKNEILFSKNVNFTKTSWSEHSFKFKNKVENGVLELSRGKTSFGRVEIGRIVLDDNRPKVMPKKRRGNDSHFDNYLNLLSQFSLKKKVAVIIPYGIYGGGEVYLKNIFANTKDIFNIDFLYLSKNTLKFEMSNTNIKHKDIGNLNRLSATLVNNRYDTVIFYNSARVYNVVSKLKVEDKINSNIIEIYHSDFLWQDAVAKLRERVGVDFIFRVSQNLAVDILGVPDERKMFVPVGIDTKLFIRKENTELRSKLGIDKNKTIFGMVARLSPEKNIEYALRLVKGSRDIHLLIIGSGPLSGALQRLVKEDKIDNVSFLGYKNNVQEFYNIFDAFLLTSKIEGTPISILEAMSCSLPIYSTDAGQIKNDFGHLDNFHILSGSPDDDKEFIKRQINMPNYCQNLREYIVENHNIDIVSNKFFTNILNGSLNFIEKDKDTVIVSGEYI
jgi:glycosyltransferase involved in cell wall biosynthesis